MPKDGTVHELTNRTIIFLEPLLDYADTAGAMLLLHGEWDLVSAIIIILFMIIYRFKNVYDTWHLL